MTAPDERRGAGVDPHEGYEQLAVGYALSALEPDDEARFAAHLPSCTSCRRAVADHEATLAHLAQAVPQVEPPPALLEGIRAGVRAEPRAGSPLPASAPKDGPPAPQDGPPAPQDGPPDELAARRPRAVPVRRSHLLVAAAAVAAVLLGLGGWNAALQRDSTQQQARVESLASTLRALGSADSRTVRLASPQGEVLAVAVVQGEQVSLVVDGLDPNPDDTVYALWGQTRGGDVVPVGSFDVSGSDLEVLPDLRLEPDVDDVTMLMVTREPGRTLPETTSQQVLVSGAV